MDAGRSAGLNNDLKCILAAFAQHNPTLIFDGRRMQTIGMAAWVSEQCDVGRMDSAMGISVVDKAIIFIIRALSRLYEDSHPWLDQLQD